MPDDKGLNRGGPLGQEGELSPDQRKQQGKPEKRDPQKQSGVIEREPSPEEKQKIQPTHPVD
jgi:hypothetical protein